VRIETNLSCVVVKRNLTKITKNANYRIEYDSAFGSKSWMKVLTKTLGWQWLLCSHPCK